MSVRPIFFVREIRSEKCVIDLQGEKITGVYTLSLMPWIRRLRSFHFRFN